MNLTSQLATLKDQGRGLAPAERAKLCCRLAKQLEKAGEYEAACEALSEFWPERSRSPRVDGLDKATKAEVLLRVGMLTGWLGSTTQSSGTQEAAKNLITRSIEIFERLGESQRAAEARSDLALCYWREGSFDEALINLVNALSGVGGGDSDLKAVVLSRQGMVELAAGRLNEALRILNECTPLLEQSTDDALKGTFHNQRAVLFKNLARAEPGGDYADRALIEYAAASFHFEQAGHTRYQGCVDINLGFLFSTLGRFAEAHEHLDRARNLFVRISDSVHLAQVNDTRARTLLAEGRLIEAGRFARSAVKTLEEGGEQALLAEALTTYGIILAHLGNYSRSKVLLEDAIKVAETAGDLEGAGRAKLSIIEEISQQSTATELASIYQSAADLLLRSQDRSMSSRLIRCARTVIDALAAAEGQNGQLKEQSWEGFSFKHEVLRCEKAMIERALRDASGSVTRAARLLGFGHHQSLIALINSRHKDLLKTRSTVRKRRHHIFSEPRKIKKKGAGRIAESAAAQISLLHIEADKAVARSVADRLAPEGIEVDSCTSGTTALKILTSDARYNVIVIDSDLPGLSGLELVRRARSMARWRGTRIIMLSGDDCEKEAWRAGVDAFLRKPEDIDKVSSTIARLREELGERID
jgi:CheY-like chemotaxis protein/tetratricopeptide (TPR) repeat protein